MGKTNVHNYEGKVLYVSPISKIANIGWQDRLIRNLMKFWSAFVFTNTSTSNFGKTFSIQPWAIKVLRKIKLTESAAIRYFSWGLRGVVRKMRPGFVLINFFDFAVRLAPFIRSAKVPVLVYCHGRDISWDYIDPVTGQRHFDEKFFKKARLITNKAFFIANSSFTKSELMRIGIAEDRIFIKYFGLDVSPSVPTNPNGHLKILFVGRMIDCKGPVEVVQAFIKAKSLGLKGSLTMAGDGRMLAAAKETAEISPYYSDVHFLGATPPESIDSLLREHHVLTAHSKRDQFTNQIEAFGVSFIEALAFGLPVVTGRSGGVVDIVEDGHNGFLIEPGDVTKHAVLFLQLENDNTLYQRLSKNAKGTAAERFSVELENESFSDILRAIRTKIAGQHQVGRSGAQLLE